MLVECEHLNIKRDRMPEGSPHYEKISCADCGSFRGWGKKPETIAREQRNREHIRQLQSLALTEWEKGFVASVAKTDKLSPKQQVTLDKIFEEHQR